ncbi:putative integral membrane protein [Nostocoides japonicum T1-X7]|uniref:Putative integral membrane protein n=1 Tax=Nostocoides japonicum T1-X7 TaxID=1194083 RepID=A0A077M1G4_9MICO|nr:NfeD family protein [Tetrasphaera japonica]CCH79666.1 putative integral membrane protein [Tetrasphaera japonica T1-X7]
MEWIGQNPWLAWLGLALVLAAIETATVDFTFIMLSGGALGAMVAAAVGAPVWLQVVVFVVIATALVFVVRPLVRRRFMDTETHLAIGSPALVGRAARVVQTVTEYDGRVKLAGETWSARLTSGEPACQPGQEVRVIAIEGATAIVTRASTPASPAET